MVMGPQSAHHVRTPDAYRARALESLVKRGMPPLLMKADIQPIASISQGRWVCDCAYIYPSGEKCMNCPSASPEWNLAICLECGSEYVPIFPEERERVERAMSKRPLLNRNFYPHVFGAVLHGVILTDASGTLLRGETVEDLERENEQFKEITIQERVAAYERKLRGE